MTIRHAEQARRRGDDQEDDDPFEHGDGIPLERFRALRPGEVWNVPEHIATLAGAAATGARILIGIVLIIFLLVVLGIFAVT